MRKCVVEHCTSTDKTILSHRFPKPYHQALKWQEGLNVLHIPMQELLSKYVVCTLHFKRSDYRNAVSNYLNTTAIPLIVSHEQSQTPEPEDFSYYDTNTEEADDLIEHCEDQCTEQSEIVTIENPLNESIKYINPHPKNTYKKTVSVRNQKRKAQNNIIQLQFNIDDLILEKQRKVSNDVEYLDEFSSTAGDDEINIQSGNAEDMLIQLFETDSPIPKQDCMASKHDNESVFEEYLENADLNNQAKIISNYTKSTLILNDNSIDIIDSCDTYENIQNRDEVQHIQENNTRNITDFNDIENIIEEIEEDDINEQHEIVQSVEELVEDEEEGEFKGLSRKELIDQMKTKDTKILELENKLESIEKAQAEMAKSMEAFKKIFNPGL